jgi:hypothetical protein
MRAFQAVPERQRLQIITALGGAIRGALQGSPRLRPVAVELSGSDWPQTIFPFEILQGTGANSARPLDAAARDAAFDDLLQQIGAVLEADPTLGSLAFGLTYGRPGPSIEAVAGAPAIKSATLSVTIDYETGAPLS